MHAIILSVQIHNNACFYIPVQSKNLILEKAYEYLGKVNDQVRQAESLQMRNGQLGKSMFQHQDCYSKFGLTLFTFLCIMFTNGVPRIWKNTILKGDVRSCQYEGIHPVIVVLLSFSIYNTSE